jgi:hypothetical protein
VTTLPFPTDTPSLLSLLLGLREASLTLSSSTSAPLTRTSGAVLRVGAGAAAAGSPDRIGVVMGGSVRVVIGGLLIHTTHTVTLTITHPPTVTHRLPHSYTPSPTGATYGTGVEAGVGGA